jgi:hypothetical protein
VRIFSLANGTVSNDVKPQCTGCTKPTTLCFRVSGCLELALLLLHPLVSKVQPGSAALHTHADTLNAESRCCSPNPLRGRQVMWDPKVAALATLKVRSELQWANNNAIGDFARWSPFQLHSPVLDSGLLMCASAEASESGFVPWKIWSGCVRNRSFHLSVGSPLASQ